MVKECPVTEEGCAPVITVRADMRWVKRGFWLAVAQLIALLITLATTVFSAVLLRAVENRVIVEANENEKPKIENNRGAAFAAPLSAPTRPHAQR